METKMFTVQIHKPVRRKHKSKGLAVVLSGFAFIAASAGFILGSCCGDSKPVEPVCIVEPTYEQLSFVEETVTEDPIVYPEYNYTYSVKDREAMAKTIWGEARGCSKTEQAAVAW